ncbi:SDR family NAD(P)-dependent oxidoreductase [Candidatus Poriferisocius sp.]|uniref:SDR family NAD(P)-dependent oxidoreductase n=1 Tax=Candidatus Poriferisocius sp. TaxID=3101276 RepID=UPI003B5AF5DE
MSDRARHFRGRTVVVTGAGRGLGRAYALLLAELGATVVVNDRGTGVGGHGADGAPAARVVEAITTAGGSAVADASDVADPDGAAAMIHTAIEVGGRLDAVINNAGIMRWGGPDKTDPADLDDHVAVHLSGAFNTTRAAWPHFVERGYGRVVNTASTGMLGLATNLAYAAAKGGVVGLSRSLAVAGRRHGIRVNVLAPAAMTRMAGPGAALPNDAATNHPLDPALAAPMAALLAHEDCPVSGEILVAGGGRFSRLFFASTPGWLTGGAPPSLDDLLDHWDVITSEANYTVPADLGAWSAQFLDHVEELE